MKTIMTTTAVAALLWAGVGSAQAAATATETPAQDHLRTRDQVRDPGSREGDGTPDRIQAQDRERDHASLDPTQDRFRERARDRMHQALAERAALPANAPELPAGATGAHARDRDRLHEAEAIHAAERHLARTRAGEAARAREGGAAQGDPGARMGAHAGAGAGECGEAAGQRRIMDMHGGSMDRDGGGGGGGGGPGGHR